MTDEPTVLLGTPLSITICPDRRTVRVEGELDLSSAPVLLARIGRLASGPGPLALDLGQLEFLDVRGAWALVELAVSCRVHGSELLIVALSPQARRVLELVDVERRTGQLPAADAVQKSRALGHRAEEARAPHRSARQLLTRIRLAIPGQSSGHQGLA